MQRPVTLLAAFALFLLVPVTVAFAQTSTEDGGATTPPAQPPASEATPDPEPQPEPQLAESSEGASPAPEPAAEIDAAEGEAGAASAELPPRAAGPTTLVAQTQCEGRRIRAVRVRGNGRVSADDVRAAMKLKVGSTCTDVAVARDAHALWDLGYFDDLIFAGKASGDELALTVTVKERPAIGRVTFEGNGEISQEDLEEKVTLDAGAILSETDVRRQLPKIRDLYAEEGYFLAKVGYNLVPMPRNRVEVRFEISEGPEVSVRRVQFIGNDHISDDELLGFMRTHSTGFFSFLSSNDTFKRDFFDEDVLRIQALYYDRGYLNVRVATPRVELTPDRKQIDVTIPVEEGHRFKIGRFRVVEYDESGKEVAPLGGRRAVREKVDANPGEYFSRTKLTEGIEAITRHYRDAGYAKVDVTPQTDLDDEARTVDLAIAMRRGPICHIERIVIQGNDKTRDRVLRRELLVVEGDTYSQTKLERSKDRINALGYFETVNMAESSGEQPAGLVISYEVKERPTGTFQVGAGFSSIEQFILTAQVNQQNIFGHGQTFSLQAQISRIRQLVQAQFIEPYLFSTLWSLSLDASRIKQSFSAYTMKQTTGGAAVGHPLFHRDLRISLRYNADYSEVGSSTGAFFSGNYNLGGNAQGFFAQQPSVLAHAQRSGFTSSLRLSLTYDSRDNRLFPTKGVYASISSEVADPYLGSERTFVRHRYFGRFYYPLIWGMVLRINTEAGLVTSRKPKGVPLYERFFLGGILSVRGFPYFDLGPHANIASTIDPAAAGTSLRVGGNGMLRSNVEIEFPIVTSVGIKGVVFTDAGNVWNLERQYCQLPRESRIDTSRKLCGFNDIRASWGFGLRWFSPMGPLRFEWGFPFAPRPADRGVSPFQFTIGQFF